MNIAYKNIAVLGLGKSGYSVYNYLLKTSIQVCAWDDNTEIVTKYAKQGFNILDYKLWNYEKLDAIVVSPGIALEFPKPHYVYEMSKKYNIPLICDVDIFLQQYKNIVKIGVSGTNGKSTTTALINHIFSLFKKNVVMGGNIGLPILDANIINTKYNTESYAVLELSSYQLDLINSYPLNCALMINIEEDHLDHHGNFANYVKAKNKIFLNQTSKDVAIVNNDCFHLCKNSLNKQNLILISNSKQNKSIYLQNDHLVDNYFENNKVMYNLNNLKYLKGEHNYYNIMFCYAVCRFYKLNVEQIFNYISSFRGMPHRQSFIKSYNNIDFINDSKATNVQSTYWALKAFDNIALILGGIEKIDNLDMLIELIKNKVFKVFLIGKSQELFANILSKNNILYEKCNTLDNATNQAYNFLLSINNNHKKTLLLSPACASFDQFKNFEHRGDSFIEFVNLIK